MQVNWLQNVMITTNSSNIVPVNMANKRVIISSTKKNKMQCSNLRLTDIQLNDTGLYQCILNASGNAVLTPGTYLQVYGKWEIFKSSVLRVCMYIYIYTPYKLGLNILEYYILLL